MALAGNHPGERNVPYMTEMHAIVAPRGLPISDPESLVDMTLPRPQLGPRDLLVRVEAVSVNPVDVKRRASTKSPVVLGFDAAGTVEAIGEDVTHYAVGDEVYYAGAVNRPGSNAEFQAVDERIVGRKPTSLTFVEAAALPLTAITAWESLFDRFGLTAESEGDLLVLAGAGGVGSILIQLAKKLTRVRVIATASRDDSRAYALAMGADLVVDHSGDLAGNVLDVAPDGTDYIFTSHTAGNIEAFAKIAKAFSAITAIDGHSGLPLEKLQQKSISWHWEWMFTRPVSQTPDMGEQRVLLNRVADLVDDGTLVTTLQTTITGFTAENLREAHRLVESGRTIGKVVVGR